MVYCPECLSQNVNLEDGEEVSRECSEYTYVYIRYYSCENCGCCFKCKDTTKTEVEIESHGDNFIQKVPRDNHGNHLDNQP